MAPVYLSERLKPKKYNRMTRASDNSVMELAIPFNKKKSFADRGFPVKHQSIGILSQLN